MQRIGIAFANIAGGMVEYFYDAQNKRVWQGTCTLGGSCQQGVINTDTITLFGADGRQIATYQWSAPWNNTQTQVAITFQAQARRAYFGGKLVAQSQSGVMLSAVQDRLGSVGKYYPYGEERNQPQLPNDQVKFATYTRDSGTGLDYADQRYYGSTFGRFMTADPYSGSAKAPSPLSWNRYVYAANDPVNNNDPRGLDEDVPDPGCYVNGFWIPGCDITWPQSVIQQTAYSRGVQRLYAAQLALSERQNFSTDCYSDIAAIAGQRDPSMRAETDINSVIEAAVNAQFQNGVGSTDPISALHADPIAGASAQRERDQQYGANQTIGSDFARNPNGLTAESVLGGNTIYINGGLIGKSLINNEALLFHEAFHLLGFDDADVWKALFPTTPFDPKNTKQITDKLKKDCFKGKDNKG